MVVITAMNNMMSQIFVFEVRISYKHGEREIWGFVERKISCAKGHVYLIHIHVIAINSIITPSL